MIKKGCELCSCPARVYCQADGASLCSDCDEKVHSANFLVAKHPRSLLCHVCQSATPWKASGKKLGPTVSVCDICVANHGKQGRSTERDEGERVYEDEETDCDGEDEDEDDYSTSDEDQDGGYGTGSSNGNGDVDEEEDGDNQVVPWSSTMPPPPVASSSNTEGASSSRNRISSAGDEFVSASKRTWQNADFDSEDEIGSTSSQINHNIACLN